MAKKKNPADAAKDKAAKQKKMAIGLVCLLALAMAYAVHTMMALGGGSAATKPQAVGPAAATTTTPVAASTPATAAPSLAGTAIATDPTAAPAAAGSTAGSSQLITAVSPVADPGQLGSFSRFETKDPFVGGGSSGSSSGSSGSSGTSGTSGSSGSGTSSGSGSGGSSGSSPPVTPPAPPNPPPTSAVISVNGVSESVSTGGIFPTANPNAATNGLFDLVSLTSKTAVISVVGGSYASGSQTLTLTVNKSVTLVNTADGTRYTILLYAQGTAVPTASTSSGSSSSSGATSSPATTTPATTTPATTSTAGP
jgi:hypothetical protein